MPRPRFLAQVAASFCLLAALAACSSDEATAWHPSSVDAGADGALDGASQEAGDAADGKETKANVAPTAAFTATPEAGPSPLEVAVDASASKDSDGTIASWKWGFDDGTQATGKTAKHTFSTVGCHKITLTVTDDDQATATADKTVVVTKGAPTGAPVVTLEPLPIASAVLPRDLTTNKASVTIKGKVSSSGYDHVVVELLADKTVVDTASAPLCSAATDDPFEVKISVPAELVSHALRVSLVAGKAQTQIAAVDDLVAGDILLVQGQSNAVAAQQSGDANVNQGPFLRSFGTHSENAALSTADKTWHQAEGNLSEGPGAVGQWALRMGKLLVDQHKVPIGILNGARGGMPINYFQRNDANPVDPTTNYGRLLQRARDAGVDGKARALLYYQGESDGAGATVHHDGWVAVHAAWVQDYPALERTYVTQIRLGCGNPTIQLLEVQRHFADELTNVSVMSTTGLDGHDGCHFAYSKGYEVLGNRYASLLSRDLFAAPAAADVEAPNPKRASFSKADHKQIKVEMRDTASTLTWGAGSQAYFVVEGATVTVTAGQAQGSNLLLDLSAAVPGPATLTYTGHTGAGPWVVNAKGVGLLAFDKVAIESN